MDIIIDTNIFYYWSGLTESDYNKGKIEYELKQLGNIYISELSFLEFITHFKEDKNSILKGIEFLSKNNIGIIKYFKPEYTILFNDLYEMINNPSFLEQYYQIAFSKKLQFEADFLSYWLSCIISIISVYLFFENKLDSNEKQEKFERQYTALILSIRDKEGYLIEQLSAYLNDFYLTGNESEFKSNINNIFLDNLYVLMINYTSAKHNKLFTQLGNGPEQLKEEELKIIFDDLYNHELTNNIFKKMSEEDKAESIKKGKILISFSNEKFIKALKEYKSYMKTYFNPIMIEYYIILFEKFITLKNKKINKNDIIDSNLLLMNHHFYKFITADTDLQKIIKSIDEDYYIFNKDILNKFK